MTAVTVLIIVLLVFAIAACAALIWVSREMIVAARSLQKFSQDVSERLLPILEKADVTVDAANAELLRIDLAITRFEDASLRVGAASDALSDILQAPGEIVSGVAGRVRRAWKDRKRESHDSQASPTPEDDVVASEVRQSEPVERPEDRWLKTE